MQRMGIERIYFLFYNLSIATYALADKDKMLSYRRETALQGAL